MRSVTQYNSRLVESAINVIANGIVVEFSGWPSIIDEDAPPLDTLRKLAQAEIELRSERGCALVNVANELSTIDDEIRTMLADVFADWSKQIADALERGRRDKRVHASIDPLAEAAFVVTLIKGASVATKCSRDAAMHRRIVHALNGYLDTLAAPAAN